MQFENKNGLEELTTLLLSVAQEEAEKQETGQGEVMGNLIICVFGDSSINVFKFAENLHSENFSQCIVANVEYGINITFNHTNPSFLQVDGFKDQGLHMQEGSRL